MRNLQDSSKKPAVIFLVFLFWTFLLSYPLILHPVSHVPQGSEGVGTVPFFNLWTLQWNIKQLLEGYTGYWNAPIFSPTTGAFAFSELQPLSALLAAPLWVGLQAPGLAYNGLLILFLTLNGWFTYWLLRIWRVTHLPALLAGILAQSIPFVAQEMGVLQLLAIFGFLWPLLYLNRFLLQPGWSNGLGLVMGLPVAFFSCSYYGFFSLLFLPLAFLSVVTTKDLTAGMFARLLVVAMLALALFLPLILTQKTILDSYNLARSEQTIQNSSAQVAHYGRFLDYNLLYAQILHRQSGPGQRLFPGFGLLFLAGLGIFRGKAHRLHSPANIHRSAVSLKVYLVLTTILALALSLGLNLHFGTWQPYQLLRQTIPGFGQLRSPFRFAVFAQLHLVLLAGFGLNTLIQWPAQLPKHPTVPIIMGRLLAVTIIGFTVLEMLALPLPLQALPPQQANAAWQTWLNQRASVPRIVLIPFARSRRVADFEQTTRRMLLGSALKTEMINGYSGFFPPGHTHLRQTLVDFPTPAGFGVLQDYGVDYVVVDHRLANTPSMAVMQAHLALAFYDVENQVAIYILDR